MSDIIELKAVDSGNWRDVAGLEVAESQKDIVQQSSYYLALCHYGKQWKPLAVELDGKVIGFMMWAVDDDDGSCWLGGIIIDLKLQGQGYGHRAVKSAVTMLSGEYGFRNFALSCQRSNTAAKHVYEKIGFRETGETEDDEVVARLPIVDAGK